MVNQLEQYSREDVIFMARLYERAEKFDEMVKCINQFIRLNPKLTLEERNILSAGYKCIVSNKRFSWRYLQNMINKEGNTSATVSYIEEIKSRVEEEIIEICKSINTVLDELLIPNETNSEDKVFYLKMKADYFRYQCEFLKEEKLIEVCDIANKAYLEAYKISEETLPISSTTRLGTALNYSVFLYEIKQNQENATSIAKAALDEGMKILDNLEKNKQKDTILIIQLLMENLMLWNVDEKDKEE